ncbi:FeoB small GTPase domain-containing protein, partial [Acinetobacter baumannii]|nr:FeoB small GTPase domain-containing protein [Acinetobacter baumannii]
MILNIIDGSNLERNLYLTLQLLETGIPCVIAVNMCDVLAKRKDRLDVEKMSHMLGCPVIEISALKEVGITEMIAVVKKRLTEHA